MKPLSGHRLYIMYAVLLFMAFAVLPIHGQVNLNNRFKNLTLQSGLADNKVNTIYQDERIRVVRNGLRIEPLRRKFGKEFHA